MAETAGDKNPPHTGGIPLMHEIMCLHCGKAQHVTIKRLTCGNPTMAGKFAEVKKGEE